MRLCLCVALAGIGLALAALAETNTPGVKQVSRRTTRLGPAELLLDASEHGDVLVPQFADFDGDGVTDLLLGVGDRLLVYHNRGTNSHPDYARPVWFDETEPSAILPRG